MGPLGGDAAAFQDDDQVGVLDRAEAVGDGKGGSPLEQAVDGFLDQPFAGGIQIAGGFIKYEDAWIGKECSGNGQSLALPSREPDASFTNEGVKLIRERFDELHRIGRFSGKAELLVIGASPCEGDILADRAFEEKHILFDDAQQAPVFLELDISNIHAIQMDRTLGRIVEPGDQIAECGLACA